jgi:LAO/AO transport system kinase
VFVVNKADRDGADSLVAEIEAVLMLAAAEVAPAIVKTTATLDEGTAALLEAIEAFRERAETTGALARKRLARLRRQLEQAVQQRVMGHLRESVLTASELETLVARLAARELDPLRAADEVVSRMGLA